MLPIYPFLTVMAASVLVALVSRVRAKKRNLPGTRAEYQPVSDPTSLDMGNVSESAWEGVRGGTAGDHKGLVKIPRIFLALPTPPPSPLRTDNDPTRVGEDQWPQEGARATDARSPLARSWSYLTAILPYAVIAIVLAGTMFHGLALLNVYSQPDTRIQASRWIYSHLQPGSVLTYEQWADPLPVAVDNADPSIFRQATYLDANGQPQTGLDLYGDASTAKAHQLAHLFPAPNAITMATDRLDKSIPRLPSPYPLTIHYYQLLFSGQLGF